MANPQRQEVLNVLLAQLLQERGVVAAPENIIKSVLSGVKMPDVLVEFNGLRTIIEGEVGDQPDAEGKAIESARKRVAQGIAHIGVALVYPARLRDEEFIYLKSELAHSKLKIAIFTESEDTGFIDGDVGYLENALRHAFDQLVKEDVVAQAVALLDAGIEQFAGVVAAQGADVRRMAEALGIREMPDKAAKQKAAISRIGGLVLVNALIFQEILASHDERIPPLHKTLAQANLFNELSDHWQFILDSIDYYPIFYVARQVLLGLSASQHTERGLTNLAQTAQGIVKMQAALRHDLMGRVYHRLLVEAKYLGTYYTSIPAAILLLKIALRPDAWPVQWHNLDQVRQFRVADLACGTGTLLMASADALTDNYISASAQQGQIVDLGALHAGLTEDVLHGYDVLPSAIHLTASTLALKAPDVSFTKMNLFSLPLGGPHHRLGSIEFLESEQVTVVTDLFGAMSMGQQVTGEAAPNILSAPLPQLDLCVMNPPFTRSVGGNLLFGSVPEPERQQMQKKLQKLVARPNVYANITAGLGSVFVAAADRHIKVGGRIALVLPKALLSGVAWGETRQLLLRNYRVEYLVASQDPERWNFSESTDLSEVLLVATKINNHDPNPDDRVVALNLWDNQLNIFETLATAYALIQNGAPDIETGQGELDIVVGHRKVGQAIAIPWSDLKTQPNWMLPCAFAQSDLIRVAYHLLHGDLWLPGFGKVKRLHLCPLGELGTLGPDRRDIHDGFKITQAETTYPAFWGHDASAVYTLAQQPNEYLAPLRKAKEGRNLRRAKDLWPLAGKVLIGERLRLNTQRLVAVRLAKPVLSNVWWPFALKKGKGSVQREKALVLWLNSTPGLILLLAHREETEGAWVDFKKPTLAGLPVLDLDQLTPKQFEKLVGAYDRLCHKTLCPLSEMREDDIRAEIDQAIAQALKLPDLTVLRQMLGLEPVMRLQRIPQKGDTR